MKLALLLGVAIAAKAGATTPAVIRIDRTEWVEAVEKLPSTIAEGERYWTWSHDCAPRRITALPIESQCKENAGMLQLQLEPHSDARNVRVVWGTAELLRDVPDALLPAAISDENGRVLVGPVNGEPIYARVADSRWASDWSEISSEKAGLIRLSTAITAPMVLTAPDGTAARQAVVSIETTDLPQVSGLRIWAIASQGRIELPPLPKTRHVRMTAWGADLAPRAWMARTDELPERMTLPAGVAAIGRCHDSDDAAVRAAAVEITTLLNGTAQTFSRTAQTNERGEFVVRGLPPGPARWTITKPGHTTLEGELAGTVSSIDLGTLELRRARNVRFMVSDAQGDAIDGARFSVNGVLSAARSDRNGALHVLDADAGPLEGYVEAGGFKSAAVTVAVDAAAPIAVVLQRAAAVRGKVIDRETRNAVNGGSVFVTFNDAMFVRPLDASGEFIVDDLDAGVLRLELRGDGFAPLILPERQLAAGERLNLGEMALVRGAAIVGTALDAETRAPQAGAKVRLLRSTSQGGLTLAYAMGDWQETTTDERGEFALRGVPDGMFTMVADAAGRARVIRRSIVVDAAHNALVDVGELAFAAGGELQVTCEPVRRCGTNVKVVPQDGADWSALNAPLVDGVASVSPVASGEVLVQLLDRGALVGEQRAVMGRNPKTTVRIVMNVVTLKGRALWNDKPLAHASLIFRRPAADGLPVFMNRQVGSGSLPGEIIGTVSLPTVVETSGRGEFTVELAPGRYDVEYVTTNSRSVRKTIDVSSGPANPLLLAWSGGGLEGTVQKPDGTPAGGAIVVARDSAGRTVTSLVADSGRFSVDGLAAGAVEVTAEGGGLRARKSVQLSGSADHDVTLVLERRETARVVVRVHAPSGAPAAGAYVFLVGTHTRMATTGATGEAEFSGDADGEHRVAAWSSAYGWVFAAAGATAQSIREVTFESRTGALDVRRREDSRVPFTIRTAEGFPLDRALKVLGADLTVSAAQPFRLAGLPLSTKYAVASAGCTTSVALEAGSIVAAECD